MYGFGRDKGNLVTAMFFLPYIVVIYFAMIYPQTNTLSLNQMNKREWLLFCVNFLKFSFSEKAKKIWCNLP